MIYSIIITIIAIILLIYLLLYRKEIASLKGQIEDILDEDTKRLLTQNLYGKELNGLVDQINKLIVYYRDESRNIKKKGKVLRQVTTNLSHDIRTPLTSMDGYVQMLEEAEEPDKERYLKIIRLRIKKLSQMLDELFLYMKLENEDYEIELKPLDCYQVLLESLFSYYEEFEKRGLVPDIDIGEESCIIEASEKDLSRVFDNLIKNAFVHGKSSFKVKARRDGDQVLIRIINDVEEGREIDPDRSFEEFYKGDESRTEESTGLGLSIVKGLVDKQNGRVFAESRGNLFIINLSFNLYREESEED